jgi:hypothetical protein
VVSGRPLVSDRRCGGQCGARPAAQAIRLPDFTLPAGAPW